MKRSWGITSSVLICVLFLLSSQGNALWVGQSQVTPFLEIGGEYESNIFEVSDDQEEDSDFITIVSPGIYIVMPWYEDSAYRATLLYRADVKFYGQNGDSEVDPDEELNTVDHHFDAQLLYNLASGLRLKAGYVLNVTSTDPDFRGDERDPYLDHRFLAQAAYAFANRYEAQVQYNGAIRSYEDAEDEIDDYTRNGLEATLFYRLYSRLSILGGGSFAMYNREEPLFSDSVEYAGFTGVRYEVTGRTTGMLKVGALVKDFDNEAIDNKTDLYLSGEVQTEFSEATTMTARLYRNFVDTSSTEETAGNGAYYITTGVYLRGIHKLNALPKLSLSGTFSYSNDDYSDDDVSNRSDDNLVIGAGVDYEFYKYVTLGAKYTYKSTDSNVDINDFTDNIAMFTIRGYL